MSKPGKTAKKQNYFSPIFNYQLQVYSCRRLQAETSQIIFYKLSLQLAILIDPSNTDRLSISYYTAEVFLYSSIEFKIITAGAYPKLTQLIAGCGLERLVSGGVIFLLNTRFKHTQVSKQDVREPTTKKQVRKELKLTIDSSPIDQSSKCLQKAQFINETQVISIQIQSANQLLESKSKRQLPKYIKTPSEHNKLQMPHFFMFPLCMFLQQYLKLFLQLNQGQSRLQINILIKAMLVAQDNQSRHFLSLIIPNTFCKILNNAIIIINLWWAQNNQFLTVGMGFATIFSFVCGYLLIISLNIGLTYEISRKRNDPNLVGIFYQRALLVNFLFCAFFITPLLYASDKIVGLFSKMIPELYESKAQIGNYLYQLVPSIWAFAFYDTTQTFLQAQGRILAPLIIQFIAVIMHLAMIKKLGPAWSKNFADFFSSIAIYCYIIVYEKNLKSWTEWTIKCIKGWRKHIKFLQIIGLATYTQAIFFFFFSLLAYRLEKEQLICHIYYINIYQIIYLIFIGIQEGSLAKIGYLIEKNQHKTYRKQAIQSIKLCVGACILLVIFMYIYEEEIHRIFRTVYEEDTTYYYNQSATESAIFYDNFVILSLALLIDSYQIGISSMLKALNTSHSILKILSVFYILTYFLCFILCYYYKMQLRGLWVGWLIGLTINSIIMTFILKSEQKRIRREALTKQNFGGEQRRNI